MSHVVRTYCARWQYSATYFTFSIPFWCVGNISDIQRVGILAYRIWKESSVDRVEYDKLIDERKDGLVILLSLNRTYKHISVSLQ